MKNLSLKRGVMIILSLLLSLSANSQIDTNRIWVTIDQQVDVPIEKNGKLFSNNSALQQLIQDQNIINVEQAVPSSRRSNLLKIYEVECVCEREALITQI